MNMSMEATRYKNMSKYLKNSDTLNLRATLTMKGIS